MLSSSGISNGDFVQATMAYVNAAYVNGGRPRRAVSKSGRARQAVAAGQPARWNKGGQATYVSTNTYTL